MTTNPTPIADGEVEALEIAEHFAPAVGNIAGLVNDNHDAMLVSGAVRILINDVARSALSSAGAASGAVKVKALEWRSGEDRAWWQAEAFDRPAAYEAWTSDIGTVRLRLPDETSFQPFAGTIDEAKAAAQADFETRILSALTAAPPSPENDRLRDRVRELEEQTQALLLSAVAELERGNKLAELVEMFRTRIERHGEWDDGCFYHNGTSASELQEPLRRARSTLGGSSNE